MAERPEDLNIPISVVQKVIKEVLPEGVIVSKEARQSISRASSVFVLYLTSCAVTHKDKNNRKTLAVSDIINAVSDMEFDNFIPAINEALKARSESLNDTNKKIDENDRTIEENESDIDVETSEDSYEVIDDANNLQAEVKKQSKKRKLSHDEDNSFSRNNE